MGRKPLSPENRKISLYVGIPGSLYRRMKPQIELANYLLMGIQLDEFLEENTSSYTLSEYVENNHKRFAKFEMLTKQVWAFADKHPELLAELKQHFSPILDNWTKD